MVDFQKTPISLLQFVAHRKSNKRKDLAELYDYFKLNELSEQQVLEKIFIKKNYDNNKNKITMNIEERNSFRKECSVS